MKILATEILEKKYNIKVERKAVGRYIAILNEVGYEISTTKKGSYLMSRKFEDSELKLLIDGVLSSRYINPTHSKQLIEKLSSLSTEYFKPRIYSYWKNQRINQKMTKCYPNGL